MIQVKSVCPVIQDVYIVRELKVLNVQNVFHPFISIKVFVLIHVRLITTKILLPNPAKVVIDSVILVMDHRSPIVFLALKICTITEKLKLVM